MTTEIPRNPLLSAVKLPGRTMQLPSRGALYHDGEIDNAAAEVHIQPMSALDEITLKNSDLLFNGEALDQIVKTCAPAIKKPGELYARDIDALMMMLRLVTYGPEFSIKVAHDCEKSLLPPREGQEGDRYKENDYIVNIERIIMSMKLLDPTDAATQYVTTLDNGQTVRVAPVRYKDLISLYHDTMAKKDTLTAEDIKTSLIKNIVMMVDEVDGITDKRLIEEWATHLTTKQSNAIAGIAENANNWGPDSMAEIACHECGAHFKVELPLNPISFFTE